MEYGRYVSTVEQVAIIKGKEKGLKQGLKEGLKKGMHDGEVAFLLRLLQRRFGTVPNQYLERIQEANNGTLLVWGERTLDAATLEEIFV